MPSSRRSTAPSRSATWFSRRARFPGLSFGFLDAPRVDVEHLKLQLRDSTPGSGNLSRDFARFAVEAGRLALQGQNGLHRGQVLLEQPPERLELAGDMACLTPDRIRLGREPGGLLLGLLDPLGKLRRLTRPGPTARFEQTALAVQDIAHRGIGAGRSEQRLAPHNRVRIAKLRLQTIAPRHQLGVLRLQHRALGAKPLVVETHQNLTRVDPVAIAHRNRRHRTAVDVLHHLVAVLDLDLADGNDRARNRGQPSPPQQPCAEHHQRREPQQQRAAGRERTCGHPSGSRSGKSRNGGTTRTARTEPAGASRDATVPDARDGSSGGAIGCNVPPSIR